MNIVNGTPAIDLSGPDRNIFALMGYAMHFHKVYSLEGDARDIINDMMSADYSHAVSVFKKHFPFVVLLNEDHSPSRFTKDDDLTDIGDHKDFD